MKARKLIPIAVALFALTACTPRTVGQSGAHPSTSPAPRATQEPTGSESAADVGSDLVLSRRDIPGAGWRASGVPDDLGWSFALTGCAVYTPGDYPAQRHREAHRAAAFSQGHGRGVLLLVERYADGWADQAMADIRRVLQACPRYQSDDVLSSHTVEAEAFAGDDSLLVRSDHIRADQQPRQWWTAVVRHGELVATVTGTELTEAEVRRIATAQALRLTRA
jgi:hypothetical protein